MDEVRTSGYSRCTHSVRRRLWGRGAKCDGFTLIELLAVIIVIAILCAIAIPTFWGQRQKAEDASAYTLVRNALTSMQAAWTDTRDYTKITAAALAAIEPGINWVESTSNLVSTSPAFITADIGADIGAVATSAEVAFYSQSATVVDLATRSASGDAFGIQVNVANAGETGYVKVRVVDEEPELGW